MQIDFFRQCKFIFLPSQKPYDKLFVKKDFIGLNKSRILIRVPSFLTAYRRIAQGKYPTLVLANSVPNPQRGTLFNAASMAVFLLETLKLSKTLKSSRDEHKNGQSLLLQSLEDILRVTQIKGNSPVYFSSVCSILHAFLFLT